MISAPLFRLGTEVSARQARLAADYREGFLAEYRLQFDPAVLTSPAQFRPARATERAADTKPTWPITGLRFQVDLPYGKRQQRLQLDTVYEGLDGVVTYSGTVEGDDASLVTLSLQGEAVLGRILSDGLTYLVQGNSSAEGYSLTVIDASRIPQAPEPKWHAHDKLQNGISTGKPALAAAKTQPLNTLANPKSSSNGNVRVLVLYTPPVAARNNVSLLANDTIAQFNQSLASSGVASSNYASLAGVQLFNDALSTPDARCREDLRIKLRDRSFPFNSLNATRAAAFADIVLLIYTTESGYQDCGPLGRFGGFAVELGNSLQPIATTADTYALGDLTAVHELGHVLGGGHENDTDRYPNFARGYSTPGCAWQTLMGGYINCPFNGGQPNPSLQPTKRIPRWSNPTLSYNGQSTGNSGQNMQAALDVLMPFTAGWVANPPPPPASPSQLQVNPAACNGLSIASWSAVSGSTSYRLSRSASSSFSSPTVAFDGGSTSTLINLGTSGLTYLRVQACNAGGCSGYSTQALGSGFSGCP